MSVSSKAAGELATDLIHVVKKLSALRHHMPRFHPAIDASSYPVLITLKQGDQRVSEIAGCIHSDISTVSRQVSHLVSAGVAEKVSDPDDGRAQVVRLTEGGREAIAQLSEGRTEWIRSLLEGWTNQEVKEFSSYLARFDEALSHELERRISPGKEDS